MELKLLVGGQRVEITINPLRTEKKAVRVLERHVTGGYYFLAPMSAPWWAVSIMRPRRFKRF